VLHAGATPVLCDVDEATGLIDSESARAAVNDRTVAILPVHLYGQLCEMEAVQAVADQHGLMVIEDAAQAHGAAAGGRLAGSFGTAAAFSFYPSKNLGALGDGGAVTTDDSAIADRLRTLRDLGQRKKGDHVIAGFNERLDGLQAALLRVKLAHLDEWNQARKERAATYREALGGSAWTLPERTSDSCVFHLYPVRVLKRDQIAEKLHAAGVTTGVHYFPALCGQPALAGRTRSIGTLEKADAWAREELSLPIFPELENDQIARIAGVFKKALIAP
jgi:dTDP-4-amino-4,6-dideoxygalactose transaminase